MTTASPLQPYFLEHRLLVDTSSLLPSHSLQTHPRRYTQFLALSHLAGKTFVGTSSSAGAVEKKETKKEKKQAGAPAPDNTAPMSIVSLPSGASAEEFFVTVTRKMEPLWAFRSGIKVEGGAGFQLRDGEWRVRIGDAKVSIGQGQGRVRGVIVELESAGDGDEADLDWAAREKTLRSLWDALVRGSGVNMDGLRVVVKVPGVEEGEGRDMVLVRQYMELLKFART